MSRKLIASASIVTGALLFAGTANAQATGFNDDSQFIFSVDRLFPIFAYESTKTSFTVGPGSDSNHITTTNLLSNGFGFAANDAAAYNIPRFAFDYKFPFRLTIGGSIFASFTLGSGNSHVDQRGIETDTNGDTLTLFGFAPRVGYILSFNDLFAFWPRGGIEFYSLNVKAPDQTSVTSSQWALNLEPMFVITPLPHFGITVGPVIDIPISGSQSTSPPGDVTTSVNLTLFHFGITAGVLIYLP